MHVANASGQLTPHEGAIRAAIARGQALGEARLPEAAIDVVVQHWPGQVIGGLGFVGYCPTGDMIQLTFDAANENLPRNLGEPLVRTVLHELHHVHRWRGPGYGTTLGAAVLSEGLAGHFTRECCGTPPEPWEDAHAPEVLQAEADRVRAGWLEPYDHAEWFFGSKELPGWFGYTLGYRMVGQHIAATGIPASQLVHLRPEDVTLNEEDFA